MRLVRGVLLAAALLAVAWPVGPAGSARAAAGPVALGLHAATTGVAPGGTTTLLVHFRLERGWHLYWINPGDSGLPPDLRWSLPAGWRAGPPTWPVPQLKESEAGRSLAHEEELLLAVPLTAPADARPGEEVEIRLSADWLACREACVPGEGRATLRLAVGERPKADRRGARLWKRLQRSLPLPAPSGEWWAVLDSDSLCLTGPAAGLPARVRLLPEVPGWLDETGGAWSIGSINAQWRQARADFGEAPPDTLRALLVDLERPRRAWRLVLPLEQSPASVDKQDP
ncbi:MAG: protein-disulfide reductase DsbD family protein [bacterium]|jgi:thiol:disulfide interchange protein DsbD|nr:protein-disulfide reductase DsbD family protein [bacterium]